MPAATDATGSTDNEECDLLLASPGVKPAYGWGGWNYCLLASCDILDQLKKAVKAGIGKSPVCDVPPARAVHRKSQPEEQAAA